MDLKYKNITISGGVAVGKGTLLNSLKPYLQPLGWEFTSGGILNRELTKENVIPTADKVTEEFNNYIERRTEDLLKSNKNYVIEAWLAGFVAREFDDTLRVLLTCSNDDLRVDRVANRDKVSIEEAKKIIKEREDANFKEWERIYGKHRFFDPRYYHLVIDTYSFGPHETVEKVLSFLGYDIDK